MPDVEFYLNIWRGSFDGTEEELSVLLSRASDIVNAAIYPTGFTVDTVPEKVRTAVYKAVCAQADCIDSLGGADAMSDNTMTSVTLGRFSYSGGSSGSGESTVSSAASLCAQARGLLLPTGLLFRGVRIV